MKKRYKSGLLVSVLTTAALLVGSQGFAQSSHPDIPLRDHSGNTITDANTAYSPKMTCAGCHFDVVGGGSTTDSTLYAQDLGSQVDCNAVDCPDYGFGDHVSVHAQGVQDGGDVYWQTNEVLSYAHGVQASRHVNAGRNEDYTAEHRAARGDAFFTNSPGMFGKW